LQSEIKHNQSTMENQKDLPKFQINKFVNDFFIKKNLQRIKAFGLFHICRLKCYQNPKNDAAEVCSMKCEQSRILNHLPLNRTRFLFWRRAEAVYPKHQWVLY